MDLRIALKGIDGEDVEVDIEAAFQSVYNKANDIIERLNLMAVSQRDFNDSCVEHVNNHTLHLQRFQDVRDRQTCLLNQSFRRLNTELQRNDPRYRLRRMAVPGLRKERRTNWQHTGYNGR